jgi:hypothetical protein
VTVELIGLVVLALVVFAFVLEPVIRARGDQVVLDAVAEPLPAEQLADVDPRASSDATDGPAPSADDRAAHPRAPVAVDRPVAGDAS